MKPTSTSRKCAFPSLVTFFCSLLFLACTSSPVSREPTGLGENSSPAPSKTPESSQLPAVSDITPVAETPVDPPGALKANIVGIDLREINLSGIPDAPSITLRWQFQFLAGDEPASAKVIELKLVVSEANVAAPSGTSVFTVNGKQTQTQVMLPSGLRCGVQYRVELQSNSVFSNPKQFTIAEPGLPDRLQRLRLTKQTVPLISPNGDWQESMPVAPGVSVLWFELRDQTGAPILLPVKKLQVTQNPTGWSETSIANRLPSQPIFDGLIQRYYCYAWDSGLISSWQSVGELAFVMPGRLETWLPADGSVVFMNSPAFFWQPISNYSQGFLHFSLVSPDSPQYQTSRDIVRECKNGQSPGDLRSFLPGLQPGDNFWWHVQVDLDNPASSVSSNWRRAVFQPAFEEFVPILDKGKTAVFQMGSEKNLPDQQPVRQVNLTQAFSFSRTTITNAQCALIFNSLLEAGQVVLENGQIREVDSQIVLLGMRVLDYGAQFGLEERPGGRLGAIRNRENHPVIGITWDGARRVCEWLNHLSGSGSTMPYRLPSEAEWEYAAGLGGLSPSNWGLGVSGNTANYLRSGDAFEDPLSPYTRKGGPTTPVGIFNKTRTAQFQAFLLKHPNLQTQFGPDIASLDILGNVWEWCADWYLDSGYDHMDLNNPHGPLVLPDDYVRNLEVRGVAPSRVVRGGAWNSNIADINPQNRGKFPPGKSSFSIGFRLARDLR